MGMDFEAMLGDRLEATELVAAAYPFSVSIWMDNIQRTTADCLFALTTFSNNTDYLTMVYEGGVGGKPMRIAAATTPSGETSADTGNGVSASGWNNIVGIFEAANSRRIILNADFANEGVDTTSRDPLGVLDNTIIGVNRGSTNKDNMQGEIAEFAVWSGVLKNGDITALAGGEPAWNIGSNLAHYFPMKESTRWVPSRSKVSNFVLTPNGGVPTWVANHPTIGVRRFANNVPAYTVQTM